MVFFQWKRATSRLDVMVGLVGLCDERFVVVLQTLAPCTQVWIRPEVYMRTSETKNSGSRFLIPVIGRQVLPRKLYPCFQHRQIRMQQNGKRLRQVSARVAWFSEWCHPTALPLTKSPGAGGLLSIAPLPSIPPPHVSRKQNPGSICMHALGGWNA